jgi:hypothetical protein
MARYVHYVLVSGADDPEGVLDHDAVADMGLEPDDRRDADDQHTASLRFSAEQGLDEDGPDYPACCRRLSADLPDAVVTYCKLEERFQNIENALVQTYINGREGASVEHGYVLNVGQLPDIE